MHADELFGFLDFEDIEDFKQISKNDFEEVNFY